MSKSEFENKYHYNFTAILNKFLKWDEWDHEIYGISLNEDPLDWHFIEFLAKTIKEIYEETSGRDRHDCIACSHINEIITGGKENAEN